MKLVNVNQASFISGKYVKICKILKETETNTLDIDLRIYNYGTIEFHGNDDCAEILGFIKIMLEARLRALGVEV